MEMKQAIEIVKKLADGIDPYTGAPCTDDSPFQKADTVRALNLALKDMISEKRKRGKEEDAPSKAGKAWSEEEEQKMTKMFDAKTDVAQIAKMLCRTTGAIWARLEKVGKVTRNEEGKLVRIVDTPESTVREAEPAAAPAGCEF